MIIKRFPDIIISTTEGGVVKYVFNAPLSLKNVRKPILTTNPEKAYRFFTEEGAKNYSSYFPKTTAKFIPEPFAPAVEKNKNYKYETV